MSMCPSSVRIGLALADGISQSLMVLYRRRSQSSLWRKKKHDIENVCGMLGPERSIAGFAGFPRALTSIATANRQDFPSGEKADA